MSQLIIKTCFDDGMDVISYFHWVDSILLSRLLNVNTMKYYTKKGRSFETVCIDKIEKGIRSIERGHRGGDEVGTDLEFFFDKLEIINKAMYEDLFGKYCVARLKAERTKEIHS
jgi:hypothetical protein